MTVEFSAAGNLDVLLEIITAKQFDALLKIDQVEAITSFKKSYIYREMAAGTFPPSTSVGGGHALVPERCPDVGSCAKAHPTMGAGG